MNSSNLPRVVADGPLADAVLEQLQDKVEFVDWPKTEHRDDGVAAVYTYGHPTVDGALLDRLPGVRVISNYGVGVDHIDVAEANHRGIVVGNTPGILDGATADMAFTLLLAAGRRLVEGDRYARSDAFTVYDPGYMLGREIHHATLGIVGMGRIGLEIAKRARAFDMTVLYHNRRRREDVEASLPARYVSFEELLAESDYVLLSTPLTEETRGLIGREQLERMKPTATLVNIARGPVVDTDALTEALTQRRIFAAAVDVTDPEPLPRGHALLSLDNLTIAPHLGSATVETRQKMADISVENLLRGLRGEELLHTVVN
jgi:glyoxylate reductase